MGKKSREKWERRLMRKDPVRGFDAHPIPGVTVRRHGDDVVMQSQMTPEQHAAFVARIRKKVLSAPADLRSLRDRLNVIVAAAPTAEFLMRMTDRFLPHNAETYKESESTDPGINIEYPTWLALQLPAPIAAGGPMAYETFDEAVRLLHETFERTNLSLLFGHMTRGADVKPSVEDEIIAFSRSHTLAVRSPGYLFHLVPLLDALFTDEGDLARLVGFSIDDLLRATRAIEVRGWDRFYEAISDAMAAIRKEGSDILRGKADAMLKKAIPLEYRRRMTTQTMRQLGVLPTLHEERGKVLARAEELCTITPSWVAGETGIAEDTCRKILARFALPFGQPPIADNLMSRYEALELRPLVPFPGERYLAHLMHFWYFGARANFEEALRADPAAWDRYERRRSRYLENRSLELFARMLPGAHVERRLKYRAAGPDGKDTEFELDGLITYGPVLILIEGKAGGVSHAALRGAASSLRHDLREVVGDAHRQALRTRRYVTDRERATFTRADGSTFELLGAEHPEIYLVSVTLQALDVFVTRLAQLREIGILEEGDLPWSVSLLDLEVIAELIEWGPQFVHYLRRRLPLNRQDVVAIEELDMFATYLADGIRLAGALDEGMAVQIATTNTKSMDDYYLYRWGTRETPADRPRMRLADRTREALNRAVAMPPSAALAEVARLLDAELSARPEPTPFLATARGKRRAR